jgi:hypothetical protein
MKQCNIDKNKKACTCTYEPCSRKGLCCECVLYHRRNGELPGCLFSTDKSGNYDLVILSYNATYSLAEVFHEKSLAKAVCISLFHCG